MKGKKPEEEEWAFRERGKVRGVWHMLDRFDSKTGWDALCGSNEAADPGNHHHAMTNQREKVNCPECIKIMEKDK